MSTIRAVQVTATGDSSVLTVTDIPKPVPKANEVLVKVHVSGINFLDTYHRSGLYPLPLPAALGVEAAGEIVELGSQITRFNVGDRVALLGSGTYAEYTIASEERTAKLPNGVSYEEAAATFLVGMTCLGLMQQAYEVKKDDWVLIHAAAGGVGLVLCQLCKQAGAHVIGTTSSETKADLAKKAGAEHVINYKALSDDEVVLQIEKLTGGKFVDVVFDSVGAATFDLSLRATRRYGTVISYGSASGPVPPVPLMKLVDKVTRLMRFSLYKAVPTREEFAALADASLKLVAEGKIDPSIYKVYTLDKIRQAHDDIESRKTTGKLLLKL